ncbi:MAG: hypothetical protein HYZ09_02385, partial [Candidatus Kerfeldbacteria bacterium]|nr:hypothetical protein [Candidatus Kerfeldbacteria bacterium]
PLWQCTEWGQCTSGAQARTCTDQNNCGVNDGRPAESQSCSCVPDWQCSSWGECSGTIQSRTCTDGNQCGEQPPQSITVQPCDGVPPNPVTDLRATPPPPSTSTVSPVQTPAPKLTKLVRRCWTAKVKVKVAASSVKKTALANTKIVRKKVCGLVRRPVQSGQPMKLVRRCWTANVKVNVAGSNGKTTALAKTVRKKICGLVRRPVKTAQQKPTVIKAVSVRQ